MERKEVTFEDIERRLIGIHRSAYYSWIRQVVTLATGSLAALVALRNNYVPANAQALLLLKLCWAGLALSILLGVVALYGEAQIPLDAVKNLRNIRNQIGHDTAVQVLISNAGFPPKKRYIYAQKALYFSFVVSLLFLCIFAVVNL